LVAAVLFGSFVAKAIRFVKLYFTVHRVGQEVQGTSRDPRQQLRPGALLLRDAKRGEGGDVR